MSGDQTETAFPLLPSIQERCGRRILRVEAARMKWQAWAIEQARTGGGQEGMVLVTADAPDDGERLPVGLNLLLARSGSMTGAALAAAVEAAQQFVDAAGPSDWVGLIAFDGVAEQ